MAGGTSWVSKITVTLTAHMALLLVLIGQATDKDFEHDWYHPYDWTLNFNACRWTKAKDGDYRFSVYPQARLAGLPVEIAKSSNDITIDSRAQRGTGVEPEGSDSHTIAKNLAQLRVSPSSEAASEAGPSRVIAGTSSQQQDGALRRSERLLLLHSEGSEKQERPTKRPPVSTASTVPALAKSLDEYTRYPDFVVTMISSGGLDSLHSIWELKRPSDGLKMRSPADDRMDAYALDEFNVHLLQVIEQVECAFSVYRHQNKMFVFLALGCWLRYIRFSRNKMPSKETLDAARVPGLKGREIVALLRPYARQSPPFYLLNEQESDYSSLFKSYWTRSFKDVKTDVLSFEQAVEAEDNREGENESEDDGEGNSKGEDDSAESESDGETRSEGESESEGDNENVEGDNESKGDSSELSESEVESEIRSA